MTSLLAILKHEAEWRGSHSWTMSFWSVCLHAQRKYLGDFLFSFLSEDLIYVFIAPKLDDRSRKVRNCSLNNVDPLYLGIVRCDLRMIQCLFLPKTSWRRDVMKANSYRSHQYFCLWVYIAAILVRWAFKICRECLHEQLSCQLLRELSFLLWGG